jgi:hypothetical protein
MACTFCNPRDYCKCRFSPESNPREGDSQVTEYDTTDPQRAVDIQEGCDYLQQSFVLDSSPEEDIHEEHDDSLNKENVDASKPPQSPELGANLKRNDALAHEVLPQELALRKRLDMSALLHPCLSEPQPLPNS